MSHNLLRASCFLIISLLAFMTRGANEVIDVWKNIVPGGTKPILVSASGFTSEALQVLQFDLYVQGFAFTNAEAAQYLLSGSNNGDLKGQATDNISKHALFSKAYSGASLRRLVHRFADDFVAARDSKSKGIAQGKIAFKGDTGSSGEIFIADFDGHNAQAVTKDNSIVAAPSFVPGRQALYYTSYKLNHADIFYHDLTTGSRRAFARYGGSNISPAVSPDGNQVAMILSKDGWTDLYVCDANGSNLRRLTKSPQDESSPCWSPDGKWICFAAKEKEHRSLCRISAAGGEIHIIPTSGTPSPSEPDWSPDGKWIAFTVQFGGSFQIYVVEANGGNPIQLVEGEDPSWAPNSRTIVYSRRQAGAGRYVLALVDMPTNQHKDIPRIPGSNSQSQPSWAR